MKGRKAQPEDHDSPTKASTPGLPLISSRGTDGKSATWRQLDGNLVWAVAATAVNIVLLLQLLLQWYPVSMDSPFLPEIGQEQGKASAPQCITPRYPLEGPDSDWYTMKLVPPPAPCLVRGMVIEELDTKYNFRRPYTLGVLGLDDTWHLLPYLCAVQDRTMGTRTRRVLIDLGGNKFETSTLWFLRWYPLSFTEIHTFEVNKGLFQKPNSSRVPSDLVERMQTNSQLKGAASLPLPQRVLHSLTIHEKFVGLEDREDAVNITRFIMEELKLTRHDSVVIKMDIDKAEWPVLREWLTIPKMPLIVDELFVEVHYQHPTMGAFGWTKENFEPTRQEVVTLFNDLRDKGFFVHAWP